MIKHLHLFVTLAGLAGAASQLHAQGTAFTYQGLLKDNGAPANGHYDLAFAVCSGPTGLNTVSDPLTNAATAVVNGVFTSTLDFGAGVFDGSARWLLISVRTNGGGAFSPLEPRQPITSVPYAITAGNLTGPVAASQITGTLNESQLPPVVLTNHQAGVSLTGAFAGDGAGLTNLNAGQLTGRVPADALGNAWKIGGNAGTSAGTHFLGTTDNQPVEFHANNARALRLEPSIDGVPNLIGGYFSNTITPGRVGSVIAGGGSAIYPQRIAADFSGIAGGVGHDIQTGANESHIGGGFNHRIAPGAYASFVGGGQSNTIFTNSWNSTISGGSINQIGSESPEGTIAGGNLNSIRAGAARATIGGGYGNHAAGEHAIVPGGLFNQASGASSLAAGRRAKAVHDGAFAWADAQDADFFSAKTNQFSVRAGGGVRLVTSGAGLTLDGQNVFAGQNGGDLTNLNASALTVGMVPDALLSASVSKFGSLVEASEIAGGTIVPANLALSLFDQTFWRAGGNAGTSAGTHFLGTLDNRPLTFKVNGQQVLQFTPGTGYNEATGPNLVAGGPGNTLAGTIGGAAIGGGWGHFIDLGADGAVISGGQSNRIGNNAKFSVVGGGLQNELGLGSGHGVIAGGNANRIGAGSYWNVISGGNENRITAQYGSTTIGGGSRNAITGAVHSATISGGHENLIGGNGTGAAIPGGYANYAGGLNSLAAGEGARASHDRTFVWSAGPWTSPFTSTAANQFLIQAPGGVGINMNNPSGAALAVNGDVTVSGTLNSPQALTLAAGSNIGLRLESVADATYGYSVNARIGPSASIISNGVRGGFVVGGSELVPNRVGGDYASVLGGWNNTASGRNATASGINTEASGETSVALGAGTRASGLISLAGGSGAAASGDYSLAIGYNSTAGGRFATALGYYSRALHNGSFVWGDETVATYFSSTAPNQFLIRASGGVGINTDAPQAPLHVGGRAIVHGLDQWDVNNTEGDFRVGSATHRFKIGVAQGGGGAGDVWMRAHGGTSRMFIKTPGGTTFYSNEGQTAGVSLAPNGTAWTVVSDRNLKKDFAAVDSVQVLEKLAALPITQWHYQWENPEVPPHIGPMAQDFKAAFYPGADDKSITTQEADGVALAAIQGLNEKVEIRSQEAAASIQKLKAENAELKQAVNELKELVNAMNHKLNGSAK